MVNIKYLSLPLMVGLLSVQAGKIIFKYIMNWLKYYNNANYLFVIYI